MDMDKIIRSRKSIRKFTNKKPDWRDIIECIDAMRHAPKAGNNCTLKIILVNNPEKIENLSEATQQSFVSQAHYVVVVCTNPSRLISAFEERGKIYNRQQTGAAIQNFLLKIEEKGLATCWVGHFVENQVKKILSIPDNCQVEALLPVGFESKIIGQGTKRKIKINLDNILYFEKYGKKKMKKIPKLEV